MQRFFDNMKKLGMTFASAKTMTETTPLQMERDDREEIRKAFGSLPLKDTLVRDGQGQMVMDIAYAAAEQALTTFSERIANAPLTLSEKAVAAVLAELMMASHHHAMRKGLVANLSIMSTLGQFGAEIGLDGTESIEQLMKKLDKFGL